MAPRGQKRTLQTPQHFSADFHRAVATLVRARRRGDEGVEDAAGGSEALEQIRAAVEAGARASPFVWVEAEDPRAPFRWLDPIAGPVRTCFLLLREPHRLPCQGLATVENLVVCVEVVLRRQMEAQQNGCTAVPYVGSRLAQAAEDALLGAFQEAAEETRARVRREVAPLWPEALSRLPKFKHAGRWCVTTKHRSLHDALFARFLRRERFFVVPEMELRGTSEQRLLTARILEHLRARGWSVMAGCGGAGKTFLLGQIAAFLSKLRVTNEYCNIDECPLCSQVFISLGCGCGFRRTRLPTRPVSMAFSAPTNRAVAVLQRALGGVEGDVQVATLHALSLSKLASPVDVLVVDESSMLDAEHGDLIVGCPGLRSSATLFVGDDLQLSPVGRGELLRPLLAHAQLPPLTSNLRAEGALLRDCVRAVRGGCASAARAFAAPPSSDPDRQQLVFSRAGATACVLALRNEERLAYCAHAIRSLRPRVDERDEFAVCAQFARAFVPFPGEPVRFQTNDHKPGGACKGALGSVLRAEEHSGGAWTVDVQVPDGVVKVEAPSLRALGAALRPAYAITVHDAQGGEFGDVHVLLPPRTTSPLCTLEMLYTAVSRARTSLTLWPHGVDFAAYEEKLSERSEPRLTPLMAALQPA